jgi:hypothetical protein
MLVKLSSMFHAICDCNTGAHSLVKLNGSFNAMARAAVQSVGEIDSWSRPPAACFPIKLNYSVKKKFKIKNL